MNQKEIYGAIEFIDHEVRFVLGEFHNNQLNILKTESLYTDAIDKIEIVDIKKLVKNVQDIIASVSDKMGFSVNKLLLLIPSYSVNRTSKRVKIINPEEDDYISKEYVSKSIVNALDLDFADDEVLINQIINRYVIDGISSNKLNLNKRIQRLYVDVDIYTGPKDLIFDYLSVIEQAGFEVLDIFLESYAMATEMALIEPSRSKNIVILRYERANLTMSLLNKGRIVSSLMIDVGYSGLIDSIVESNNISKENAEKLILTNNYLSIADNQQAPVFLYSEGSETKSINDKYLNNLLMPVLEEQFQEISAMIEPVLEDKETEIHITGKGASIVALEDVCGKILNCPTKVYSPEILGARKGSLVACLGAIYAYKDISILNDAKESSIDEIEFEEEVKIKEKKVHNESEDSMANKFKELFKMNKDN